MACHKSRRSGYLAVYRARNAYISTLGKVPPERILSDIYPRCSRGLPGAVPAKCSTSRKTFGGYALLVERYLGHFWGSALLVEHYLEHSGVNALLVERFFAGTLY